MTNENLIRNVIKGSIQRAIQESVAAIIVLIAFSTILYFSDVGSPRYFGCLVILVGTGFIAGVVWSYALSYRLLASHAPSDVGFWREAFQAQAKLLRLVPYWYCAPIGVGGLLFAAPTSAMEWLPFSLVAAFFGAVIVFCVILNRRAATQIEAMAAQLV